MQHVASTPHLACKGVSAEVKPIKNPASQPLTPILRVRHIGARKAVDDPVDMVLLIIIKYHRSGWTVCNIEKILIDYFREWRTGHLGRTRFFALAFLGSCLSIILSIAVTVLLVRLGVISQSPPSGKLPAESVAAAAHLVSYSSLDMAMPVQHLSNQAAQPIRIHAPWWITAPILHLFLANISIKRLRDIGLPGGKVYLGVHAVVAPTQFLFGAAGFAGLLLFLFSCLLLFTPTDGLK